ncbi:MAG: phosphoribosyltransferase family protein [Patescibacteria group bacterium]
MVFPIRCIACGENGKDFCAKCLSDAPCAERETAKWIFPLYDYRHPPIKKALQLLKYKGKKRLASIFAEVLYGKIMEELSELSIMENFSNPILIPIPLSAKRYRERGYNQAELICRGLIKSDKEKNFRLEKNILIKPKETEHQAQIENRQKRLENILDSFSIKDGEKMKGRNIILIDDITTTGATLNEARKTLKQGGARKIIAFTVAH